MRGAWQSSNGCADWGVPLYTYRMSLWLKDTSKTKWRKSQLCRFCLTDKLLWLKQIILKGIPWTPCWTHCESGRSFSQQYLQRRREGGREKLLSFSSKSQDSSSLSLPPFLLFPLIYVQCDTLMRTTDDLGIEILLVLAVKRSQDQPIWAAPRCRSAARIYFAVYGGNMTFPSH